MPNLADIEGQAGGRPEMEMFDWDDSGTALPGVFLKHASIPPLACSRLLVAGDPNGWLVALVVFHALDVFWKHRHC